MREWLLLLIDSEDILLLEATDDKARLKLRFLFSCFRLSHGSIDVKTSPKVVMIVGRLPQWRAPPFSELDWL